MKKHHQSILIYLLTFLALSLLLKILGIINFENNEIWGYGLIFYGISLVYISFGNHQRGRLFTGSIIFLSGLLLFIISRYEFFRLSVLIIPSLLFIFSISFLMLYLDSLQDKSILLISSFFFLGGLLYTIFKGEINFLSFLDSVVQISINYWPIILIAIGIIIIIHKEDYK